MLGSLSKLIALLAILPALSGCYAETSFPETSDPYDGVVMVLSDEGHVVCSGVVLPDHNILTANHCVDTADEALVAFREHWRPGHIEPWLAEVIARDEAQDLALLSVGWASPRVRYLALTNPAAGSTVYAVGHPHGIEYIVHRGVVSGLPRPAIARRMPATFMMVDAELISGMSGGPVLDRSGAVVGIVSGQLDRLPSLGVVSPVSEIHNFLERLHDR